MVEECCDELRAVLRTNPSGKPSSLFVELNLSGGNHASLRQYAVDPESNERFRVAANLSMDTFQTLMEFLIEVLQPAPS
jgi:hypothetical protein